MRLASSIHVAEPLMKACFVFWGVCCLFWVFLLVIFICCIATKWGSIYVHVYVHRRLLSTGTPRVRMLDCQISYYNLQNIKKRHLNYVSLYHALIVKAFIVYRPYVIRCSLHVTLYNLKVDFLQRRWATHYISLKFYKT